MANLVLEAKNVCLVTQSCPTVCDPLDCSPPGSSVHGDFPGKNTGASPFHHLPIGSLPLWPFAHAVSHVWNFVSPDISITPFFHFLHDSAQCHLITSSHFIKIITHSLPHLPYLPVFPIIFYTLLINQHLSYCGVLVSLCPTLLDENASIMSIQFVCFIHDPSA